MDSKGRRMPMFSSFTQNWLRKPKSGEEGVMLLCFELYSAHTVSGHFKGLTAVSAQTDSHIAITGILVSLASLTSKLSCWFRCPGTAWEEDGKKAKRPTSTQLLECAELIGLPELQARVGQTGSSRDGGKFAVAPLAPLLTGRLIQLSSSLSQWILMCHIFNFHKPSLVECCSFSFCNIFHSCNVFKNPLSLRQQQLTVLWKYPPRFCFPSASPLCISFSLHILVSIHFRSISNICWFLAGWFASQILKGCYII